MNIPNKSITRWLPIIAIPTLLFVSAACSKSKTDTAQTSDTATAAVSKIQDSTVVFSRAGQGEVSIDKTYCSQLDEPTRAILYYYADKFSTGFDPANRSLLTVALDSEGKYSDGKKLIEKWFKGTDRAKLDSANVSAVLPDGASNSTWFTLIAVVRDQNIRRVYFRTLDTENEEKYREATDIFQISDDHIQVIKAHDFGNLTQ